MELRERVREFLKEKEDIGQKLSQAAFAKLAGVAESTFSRWYGGTYPGDASNVENKILDYLDRETVREQVSDANDIIFAMTGISKNVWDTLDYCRLQKQIVCIYGDAGCGKTFTAKQWASDKTDIIFITASPAINSPKAILKRLARTLKTRVSGNKDDLEFEIVEKMEGRDITIIIDEAQHFNISTLEMIRSIKEATGIGLALIGNAVIYDRLLGKQEAEFAQLFSRLMMRRHIMTDQFSKDDVYKVFGNLGIKEVEYLLSVCRSRYGLRGAIYLYMNSVNNENTTEKGLKAMAREMGILA